MSLSSDAKLIALAIITAAIVLSAANLMRRSDYESCVSLMRAAIVKAAPSMASSERLDVGVARQCAGLSS